MRSVGNQVTKLMLYDEEKTKPRQKNMMSCTTILQILLGILNSKENQPIFKINNGFP